MGRPDGVRQPAAEFVQPGQEGPGQVRDGRERHGGLPGSDGVPGPRLSGGSSGEDCLTGRAASGSGGPQHQPGGVQHSGGDHPVRPAHAAQGGGRRAQVQVHGVERGGVVGWPLVVRHRRDAPCRREGLRREAGGRNGPARCAGSRGSDRDGPGGQSVRVSGYRRRLRTSAREQRPVGFEQFGYHDGGRPLVDHQAGEAPGEGPVLFAAPHQQGPAQGGAVQRESVGPFAVQPLAQPGLPYGLPGGSPVHRPPRRPAGRPAGGGAVRVVPYPGAQSGMTVRQLPPCLGEDVGMEGAGEVDQHMVDVHAGAGPPTHLREQPGLEGGKVFRAWLFGLRGHALPPFRFAGTTTTSGVTDTDRARPPHGPADRTRAE
ncbi:hypothetical protein GA0115253_1033025 [Streptomyces sp. Termitarium-T10T-6]|nr:hypothetical protein GA0115253_1033025 [Streptomyces sp. Termitarium-T10T-6]